MSNTYLMNIYVEYYDEMNYCGNAEITRENLSSKNMKKYTLQFIDLFLSVTAFIVSL